MPKLFGITVTKYYCAKMIAATKGRTQAYYDLMPDTNSLTWQKARRLKGILS